MTRPISVDVYERDCVTHVGVLGSDANREWLDDLWTEGSYSCEVLLDDADAALLQPDRVVRFSMGGTPCWQGLIEETNPTLAEPGRRVSGRVLKAHGRGLLAITDDAPMLPELGLGLITPRQRYWGASSKYYDDSAWDAATELKAIEDTAVPWSIDFIAAPRTLPTELKGVGIFWIGAAGDATPGVVPGKRYISATLTIPPDEGGEHRFHWGADDGAKTYVDANVEANETRAFLWGVMRSFDLKLDEGDHRILFELTNLERPNPSGNVTGLWFAVTALNADGSIGDVRLVSDSSCKVLADPAVAPGLTVGTILHAWRDEAQAAGYLPDLELDFSATQDSAGVDWVPIDVNFEALTTSGLDLLHHLTDEHAAEFAMAPTGQTLQAFNHRGQDRSADVVAAYAVNINRLAFRKTKPGKNVAYAWTAEGRAVEYEDTVASTAYGRKGIGISLGSAPSDDAAIRQIGAFFDDQAEPIEAVTDMQLEELQMYVDYFVGDDITATGSDGGPAVMRVAGARITEDDAGQPIVQPQLVRA